MFQRQWPMISATLQMAEFMHMLNINMRFVTSSNQEEQMFTLRHKSDVPKYAKNMYSMKAISMHFNFLTCNNDCAKGPVRNFK